jgi:hypothetical protein
MLGVSGGGRVFKLPPSAYWREGRPGPVLPSVSVGRTTDSLVADLGSTRVVRFIDLRTFGYLTRLPASVKVEASLDASHWTLVYDERPGGLALVGALAEPRVIPLRFVLPDVATRYIRINTPLFGPEAVTFYAP